jgi:ATP-dependent helicase HrpB
VPVTPEDALPAVLLAIRASVLAVLPWSDSTQRLRARMHAVLERMPEPVLPDVSGAPLLNLREQWLAPYLPGLHRLNALSAEMLRQALAASFDVEQRRTLDGQAPESLRVPGGQGRCLGYTETASPVMALKLQELCGLAERGCRASVGHPAAAVAGRSPDSGHAGSRGLLGTYLPASKE